MRMNRHLHHEDDDMELIEQALADLDAEEHCS